MGNSNQAAEFMEIIVLEIVRTPLATAALIVSVLSFLVSVLSYCHSKRAAQAQTVAKLIEEYGAPEMREAVITMRKWRDTISSDLRTQMKTVGPDAAQSLWRSIDLDRNPDADGARRRLHWYFKKIFRLYEVGHLTRSSMRILTDANGYTLLFDVVWPLSRMIQLAKIGPTGEEHFQWFETMRTKFPPPGHLVPERK